MNRNNVLIHVALAIVLILVAAFFGQLNRWRKHWKMRMVPAEEKTRPQTPQEIALAEARNTGRPEVLVKFKSDVNGEVLDLFKPVCRKQPNAVIRTNPLSISRIHSNRRYTFRFK